MTNKPRTVKKPHERRKEVVSAARALFLSKEYARTTMQDVIDALGIAKGTIYHYFTSKEELMDAVVQDITTEYIQKLEAHMCTLQGNALEKIRALIFAGKLSDEHKQTIENLHRPGNALLHSRLLAVITLKLAPLYARLFEQGCAEGAFRCTHPVETAEFFLAAAQFLTDVGIYPWSGEDLARRQKALPFLLEALLHAPQGYFDSVL